MFTKKAYHNGIVVIKCDGCKNFHLIADNLGWFGKCTNIEELMNDKQEEIKKLTLDGYYSF